MAAGRRVQRQCTGSMGTHTHARSQTQGGRDDRRHAEGSHQRHPAHAKRIRAVPDHPRLGTLADFHPRPRLRRRGIRTKQTGRRVLWRRLACPMARCPRGCEEGPPRRLGCGREGHLPHGALRDEPARTPQHRAVPGCVRIHPHDRDRVLWGRNLATPVFKRTGGESGAFAVCAGILDRPGNRVGDGVPAQSKTHGTDSQGSEA
mmetsp:Transcript_9907/g.60435  ORF Transcript_9907/g.60435 Transcript_9907/m.60435 type:complete len:204 (-) Transcript_9907:4075-4686(-)